MADEISTLYRGIKITYNQSTDRWVYELRNQERSSETLTLAKQAIDKPAPKDRSPFQRFKALYQHHSYDDFEEVEVTSLAEASRYSSEQQVWIKRGKAREKVGVGSLYADSAQNVLAISKIRELRSQCDKLNEKIRAISREVKHIPALKPEE